jgi:hypothetical protein
MPEKQSLPWLVAVAVCIVNARQTRRIAKLSEVSSKLFKKITAGTKDDLAQ